MARRSTPLSCLLVAVELIALACAAGVTELSQVGTGGRRAAVLSSDNPLFDERSIPSQLDDAPASQKIKQDFAPTRLAARMGSSRRLTAQWVESSIKTQRKRSRPARDDDDRSSQTDGMSSDSGTTSEAAVGMKRRQPAKSPAKKLAEELAECQDVYDSSEDARRQGIPDPAGEPYPGSEDSVAMCLVVREQDDDILEVRVWLRPSGDLLVRRFHPRIVPSPSPS